ncbi:hypothetical protein GF345_00225 [Candidatus Woesearchaeota archaeon]|nr:hypothetical protein [Candidatus Woesearchaeota archaeon]
MSIPQVNLEREVNVLILEGPWMSGKDCKRRDALVRKCMEHAVDNNGEQVRLNELTSIKVDEFPSVDYVIGPLDKKGEITPDYRGYIIESHERALPSLSLFIKGRYITGEATQTEL